MSSPRSEVFCDYFTITTPIDCMDPVIRALKPYFVDLCCSEEEGAFRLPDGFGLFSYRVRHRVAIYATSGGFASALRSVGLLNPFLSEFFVFPHNVSSADFTVDEYAYSPPRLAEIYSLASTGQVSFTRKSVNPSAVTTLLSPVAYDDSGLNTGSVYIGRRGRHEVLAKIYDKRQQLLQQRGVNVRDALRHELTVTSKMGITLRDISIPHDCFYHFYPSNLLSKAASRAWEGQGEGFRLEKPPERLPTQVLRSRVDTSKELKTMLELAEQIGDGGLTYLLGLIKKAYESREIASAF